MDLNRIATSMVGVYAKALYESTADDTDTILKNFDVFSRVCDKKVHRMLLSPHIYFESIGIIFDMMNESMDVKFINFLKVLVYNGRYRMFDSIKKMYCLLCDRKNNIQRCVVVSAVGLADDQKTNLENELAKKYNKTIEAEYVLDSSIMAGIVIKTDENQIDMSVRNELDQLYEYLRSAYYEK